MALIKPREANEAGAETGVLFTIPVKLLPSVLALMRRKSRWSMDVRDGLKTPMMQSSRWQPHLDDGHARLATLEDPAITGTPRGPQTW
jgi:hypothetical protein